MNHFVQHHLVTRIPTTNLDASVEAVRHFIVSAKKQWDSINYVYVLEEQKLIGVVSIKELLAAIATEKISAIMKRNPVSVHEHAHEEHVAAVAIAHSLKAVPVVNHEGQFLGIVSSDAILRILHEQHVESALRHAGFMTPRVHFLDVMKARFGELFRARVGWLLVGLLGGMLAAWVTHQFSLVLETEILIAFFIPLVLYLSAAVGGQTGMLFIRSLAVERVRLRRYFFRELHFGIFLGLFFGVAGYGLVLMLWRNVLVAQALGLTLFFSIIMSILVALFIPTILLKFGRDPAIGSGPFATIVQDVLSLIIYFVIASLLL